MILAETSIWIDHLARKDEVMTLLLKADRILMHPYVIGEVALGSLRDRKTVLRTMGEITSIKVASHDDVMAIIDTGRVVSRGVGYVDCHFLASARLANVRVWTRDKRFAAVAEEMGLLFTPPR